MYTSYCSDCKVNVPTGFYAWSKHMESDEHRANAATKKLKHEVSFFNDRMANLGRTDVASLTFNQEVVNGDDPAFGSVKRCPKCDKNFADKRTSFTYIQKMNRIKRWCPTCSYGWYELPADASKKEEETTVDWDTRSTLCEIREDWIKAFEEIKAKNMPGDYYSMDFSPVHKAFDKLNNAISKLSKGAPTGPKKMEMTETLGMLLRFRVYLNIDKRVIRSGIGNPGETLDSTLNFLEKEIDRLKKLLGY